MERALAIYVTIVTSVATALYYTTNDACTGYKVYSNRIVHTQMDIRKNAFTGFAIPLREHNISTGSYCNYYKHFSAIRLWS